MEKELSALTLMSHVLRVAFGSGSAAEPDGGAAGVPQAAEAFAQNGAMDLVDLFDWQYWDAFLSHGHEV